MKKIYLFIKLFEFVGKYIINLCYILGKAILLLLNIINIIFFSKKSKLDFIKQIYFIGVLSLSIILVSALFIGMVVGLQGFYIVQKFGTEEIIGKMISLTIIRELGPVVSAMLFIGRTGSSLTAEICLMKSTDQLSSMEMMGINPIRKIVIPRFFACLISMFFLSTIFIVVAICGSYFSTVMWLNIESYVFWSSIEESVDFRIDIVNSLIKSLIFGFIITWISLFQGLNSEITPDGIVKSMTNTVVYSTFCILGINFVLTALMFNWV